MSINQEHKATPISKLATYLGITLTLQLIGLIATFVYSSYFNRTNSFADSFLFRSADSPPTPVGFNRPPSFGNHFFGDYLWVYAEIKQIGSGGYFGVSQLFLLVASKLPYYASLVCLLATGGLLMYLAARSLLPDLKLPEQLLLLTGGFLFSQPVLLAIDRGQMHFLLFPLLLLGLSFAMSDGSRRTWGGVLMAAAISMKLTPVFFLLLFVKKRRWKDLRVSLLTLFGLLLLPIAYLPSGFGAWKYQLGLLETNKEMSLMYNSKKYFAENVAHNNSFKLLTYHFSQMDSAVGQVGDFIFDNYFWFAGLLGIFLCWLIVQKCVTLFESALLMAIASSLLIPIASTYTLMVFILPVVVVMSDKEFVFSRMNLIYCFIIGVMLMPKQIALSFAVFQDASVTFGGILNSGLSLLVVIFITCKCFYLNLGNSLVWRKKQNCRI
jgi:hypothetical protein